MKKTIRCIVAEKLKGDRILDCGQQYYGLIW